MGSTHLLKIVFITQKQAFSPSICLLSNCNQHYELDRIQFFFSSSSSSFFNFRMAFRATLTFRKFKYALNSTVLTLTSGVFALNLGAEYTWSPQKLP